jgi:tRNA (guanine37-N1)-methyltransferase
VLDKEQQTLAVSLTNLDVHDIARCACTYGLGGYYLVTPLEDQRRLLHDILAHWLDGAGALSNPDRGQALRLVHDADSVDAVVRQITERTGQCPLLAGTSAKATGAVGFRDVRAVLPHRPVLALFGTGHGLAPSLLERCDAILPPLRPASGYNHLSVRSAAAIVMDRILGDWY